MRRHLLAIVASLLLVAACSQAPSASPGSSSAPGASADPSASYLYAISGATGSIDGTTLTLHAVPSVIWFTDRPERHAGHMRIEDFLASWDQGTGSFAADPPNADLSILDESGGDPIEAVVELKSASGNTSALTFEISIVGGTPPQGAFGPAALFIDVCDITYPGCPPL